MATRSDPSPSRPQVGINSPVIQATGVLPWSCANVTEFSGKEQARLSLRLDDAQKERVAALDAHLKGAFDKYKSVLRCSNWREVMKEDFITAKQKFRDGLVTTKVFDDMGTPITPDALAKGATVTAQLQPRWIYGVSGSGGLTWDVLKVRVDQAGEEDEEFV